MTRLGSWCYLLALALLCVLQPGIAGCSRSSPLPQHPDPACSDEAYAKLTAKCAAAAATCMAKGGTETECGTVCDEAADEWGTRCQ